MSCRGSEIVEIKADVAGAIGNSLPLLVLHVRKLFKDNAQPGIVAETPWLRAKKSQ